MNAMLRVTAPGKNLYQTEYIYGVMITSRSSLHTSGIFFSTCRSQSLNVDKTVTEHNFVCSGIIFPDAGETYIVGIPE